MEIHTPGTLDSKKPEDAKVLVFRTPSGDPIAVPSDVVTEGERAYRCYQARIGGMSWREIADLELYPSAGAAMYDVKRYMEEAKSLVVEASAREMLTLEVNRLDALQHALWANAMSGHVPSAGLAMNIIMNRAKLVGLDPEKMGEAAAGGRTVVVSGEGDGFLEELKVLAGEKPPIEGEPHADPSPTD